MSHPIILVCAGTAQQAREWARETGIRPTFIRYVSSQQDVRGYKDPFVMTVGTFWERSDAGRIWDTLRPAFTVPPNHPSVLTLPTHVLQLFQSISRPYQDYIR